MTTSPEKCTAKVDHTRNDSSVSHAYFAVEIAEDKIVEVLRDFSFGEAVSFIYFLLDMPNKCPTCNEEISNLIVKYALMAGWSRNTFTEIDLNYFYNYPKNWLDSQKGRDWLANLNFLIDKNYHFRRDVDLLPLIPLIPDLALIVNQYVEKKFTGFFAITFNSNNRPTLIFKCIRDSVIKRRHQPTTFDDCIIRYGYVFDEMYNYFNNNAGLFEDEMMENFRLRIEANKSPLDFDMSPWYECRYGKKIANKIESLVRAWKQK